jgi:hypothetical protein
MPNRMPPNSAAKTRLRWQIVVAVVMLVLGAIGLLGSYWIGSVFAIVAGVWLGIASWRGLVALREARSD